MKKVILTGGCGFVGHHFVEHILKNTDWHVYIFDSLTYASTGLSRIRDINAFDEDRVTIFSLDLTKPIPIGVQNETSDASYIFHLAAESHVDQSIVNPQKFINSNVLGTSHILDFALNCNNLEAFIYFGTDEVFGPAPEGVDFKEWDRYNCTNPYSASKAGAEQLVLAYMNSFDLPGFITRSMNCFTGDTKISLLDRKEDLEIKDLVGQEFWVYSYDLENDTIVPGRAHNCRKTQENVEIYEVTLDNNEKIKCTSDHLFLLRNGEYKKAIDLEPEDSLMPLYRRQNNSDREEIYFPNQQVWDKTHNMSYVWKYGKKENYLCPHHVDFNRHNNAPDNLLAIELKTHFKFHSVFSKQLQEKLTKRGEHPFQNLTSNQLQKRANTKKANGDYNNIIEPLLEWLQSEDNIEYRNRRMREVKSEDPEKYRKIALNNLERANTSAARAKAINTKRENGYFEIKSEKMKNENPMHYPETKNKMVQTRVENETYKEHGEWMKTLAQEGRHPNQNEEVRDQISQTHKNSEKARLGRDKTAIKKKENTAINFGFYNHEESVKIIGDLHFNKKMTYKEISKKFNASQGFVQNRIKEYKKNYLNTNNHKVKSIKFVGYEDVYDFTVDKYHNFALSSGVFVHNCFGERQHPEKFIPMCIRKILNEEKVTIHANKDLTVSGSRSYIHARNVIDGVFFLLDKFTQRDFYNIVGEQEVTNLELAQKISEILNMPLYYELVDFHSSRPGHDLRYSMSGEKMRRMGWEPPKDFEESLEKTVKWTLERKDDWL